MRKKKISELPLAESLAGLHTIGVDKSNNSVKVGLEFVVAAANRAIDASTNADNARATLANEVDAKMEEVDNKMLQVDQSLGTGALRALFVARGAVWNEKTGFYELNGLLDITEREMLTIYQQTGCVYNPPCEYFKNAAASSDKVSFRTNFQMMINTNLTFPSLVFASKVEVYSPGLDSYIYQLQSGHFIYSSPLLRSIKGIIDATAATYISNTYSISSLSEFKLRNLKTHLYLASGASLSYESIMYIISNAANTIPIILTLHANATARLTPEDIALASSKNITIA